MCGRFVQSLIPVEYLEALNIELPIVGGFDPEPIGRYNVAPRTRVLLLHQEEDELRLEPVPWGYAPSWAIGSRPPAINARVEKVATGAFWRGAWKSGRAVVPADGWYEWKPYPATPKHKQPYYFRLKDGGPLFFPAIGQLPRHGREIREGDGFATITMASDGGMAEIHDRRPVVLGPDEAKAWLDPGLAPREAEEILLHRGLPAEAFEWHAVGREVGNVKSEGAGLIKPIKSKKES
ncbi:SOS response-associated peptidase family protein [Pseudomonas sp. GCM10022188]|uniref:SOS response-associated peptidase family protein n=1 Tax=Pseudomonas TaxID=286 RepID=UPI001E3B19D0|nr:SOS response-associated peptidase family protein [Pseudomonas oryzagri]MCC6073997.1 SOS response-associated peptidase family protein [Pseudomonas oryzagri]